MSKPYLSIPLSLRLKAFKLNGKTKLGHGWHEPPYDTTKGHKENAHCKWNWVPERTVQTGLINGESHHGCWGGDPWKIKGSSTELRYVENLTGYFRNVEKASDIIRMDHTGWYVDNFQDSTCHGIVVQLPARNGKPVYLYGVTDPWNKNTGMIAWRQSEWTDDKKEAARWADSQAEYYAEFCREDEARESAKAEIEEAKKRIKEIRIDRKAIMADVRQSGLLRPKICEAVRSQVQELMEESRTLYKRIKKLEDNYWDAVPN